MITKTSRENCVTIDPEMVHGKYENHWVDVGLSRILEDAARDRRICGRMHPSGGFCTREPGHGEMHIAHNTRGGSTVYAAWIDKQDAINDDCFIDIGL